MISFDPMFWIIVGPTMLLGFIVQHWVKSAYEKYSKIPNARNMTGAETARWILSKEGLENTVKVEMIDGYLSDHYDPSEHTLRLSPDVYNGRSVAAIGIAAHEVGHAIQHAHGYPFLLLRSAIVRPAAIGSNIGVWLVIGGLIIQSMLGTPIGMLVAWIGIGLFSMAVLFTLITLPVEFNASTRAKQTLSSYGVFMNQAEYDGVNRMLSAAAMTYVSAAITAVANLLYLVMIIMRGGRSRD